MTWTSVLFLLVNKLKMIFLVKGKIIKKPNRSVANPGKINKIAAKANAAPDINSNKSKKYEYPNQW